MIRSMTGIQPIQSQVNDKRKETMNKRLLLQGKANRWAIVLTALLVFTLVSMQFQTVLASNNSPRFAPPKSKPYGKSLSRWGVEWWRYILSLPADINPLNDPTGVNCGVNQSGKVFFLVGTTGGDQVVRDECEVPVGKALFFPIINVVCAVPEDGATRAEVKDLCSTVFGGGENVDLETLEVSVDGVSLSHPERYYSGPRFFAFTGHEDNFFEFSCAGRDPGECYVGYHESGYSEGYWVLVRPLAPGEHELKIYADVYIPEWDFGWTVDVLYNLEVVTQGND
jgi:hypothetical protein